MKRNITSRKGFTLVEMLGVLAIIAILISVIAVGVMSAINRAQIVATTSNLKNLETSTIGFVALNTSGGTVPITEGPGDALTGGAATPLATFDPTAPADPVVFAALDNTYTFDQVLRAAGFIDNQMSWRGGQSGNTQNAAANERVFIISRNAFSTAGGAGNAWDNYNRSEASIIVPAQIAAATGPAATFGASGVDFLLDGVNGLQAARCAYVVLQGVSIKHAQALSRELNAGMDDSEFQAFQSRGRFVYAAPAAGATTVTCYYYLASF
ncbi:hypothetical protein AW736_11615 [Termitidicoccus mucosus]|uniref:Prepilin-type N-terminal cleavage/methylation domain-containing protein n=1 Tax=Termitidicoccus mucosus TaxID=1184151 RepID=A0A178IJL1_9BACT|nr:hypothetical protein AW736_11615 [Opitutaceae bacterium TSB47]